MEISDLLACLPRPRKSRRGWVSRCPAHDDRVPSLSISEGDLGLLLFCHAGCSIEAICEALGIPLRDLFYDTRPDPVRIRVAQRRRERRSALSAAESRRIDVFREAESILAAARGIDISNLSDEQLDHLMNVVANARLILLEEHNDDGRYARPIAG